MCASTAGPGNSQAIALACRLQLSHAAGQAAGSVFYRSPIFFHSPATPL